MRKHEGRKDMKKRFLMAIALLSAILLTSACSGSVSPFQNLQSSESFSGFDSSVAESSQDDSSGSSSAESSSEAESSVPPAPESSTESDISQPSQDESSAVSDISQPSQDESSAGPEISQSSQDESSLTSEETSDPVSDPSDDDISTVDYIERKYFVNKLTPSEKKNFAILYHSAKSFKEKAVFGAPIQEPELDRLMWLLNYDCPELIHLKGDYGLSYNEDGSISGVRFFYNMTEDEYSGCMKQLDDLFDSLKQQTQGMSEYETEKYVYDLMFNELVYDETTERSGSAYGALIEHYSRCEGISKGFAWCMNELGIETMTLSGIPLWENSGSFSTHSWNIIKLEGNYYNVDLTADNLRNDKDEFVVPLYSFLNQNDEVLSKTHMPLDLYRELGVPSCDTNQLNYHILIDHVITSDDDSKSRLWEMLDEAFTPEGEVYIPIRFSSAGTYEAFIDDWEGYYNEYIDEKGLDYRFARLYYNEVKKTAALHTED